jgi:hypothetical protein
MAKRRDGIEEGSGLGGQVFVEQRAFVGIEDVQVHAPCMEIDAAVVLVLLLIKTHHGLLGDGPERRSRIVVGVPPLIFHVGQRFGVDPVLLRTSLRLVSNEAMRSIHRMKLTGALLSVSPVFCPAGRRC